MQPINNELADKLQEIVALQAEIKLQENRYVSLLKDGEPLDTLRVVAHKIKYLKVELEAKEEHALTLFH